MGSNSFVSSFTNYNAKICQLYDNRTKLIVGNERVFKPQATNIIVTDFNLKDVRYLSFETPVSTFRKLDIDVGMTLNLLIHYPEIHKGIKKFLTENVNPNSIKGGIIYSLNMKREMLDLNSIVEKDLNLENFQEATHFIVGKVMGRVRFAVFEYSNIEPDQKEMKILELDNLGKQFVEVLLEKRNCLDAPEMNNNLKISIYGSGSETRHPQSYWEMFDALKSITTDPKLDGNSLQVQSYILCDKNDFSKRYDMNYAIIFRSNFLLYSFHCEVEMQMLVQLFCDVNLVTESFTLWKELLQLFESGIDSNRKNNVCFRMNFYSKKLVNFQRDVKSALSLTESDEIGQILKKFVEDPVTSPDAMKSFFLEQFDDVIARLRSQSIFLAKLAENRVLKVGLSDRLHSPYRPHRPLIENAPSNENLLLRLLNDNGKLPLKDDDSKSPLEDDDELKSPLEDDEFKSPLDDQELKLFLDDEEFKSLENDALEFVNDKVKLVDDEEVQLVNDEEVQLVNDEEDQLVNDEEDQLVDDAEIQSVVDEVELVDDAIKLLVDDEVVANVSHLMKFGTFPQPEESNNCDSDDKTDFKEPREQTSEPKYYTKIERVSGISNILSKISATASSTYGTSVAIGQQIINITCLNPTPIWRTLGKGAQGRRCALCFQPLKLKAKKKCEHNGSKWIQKHRFSENILVTIKCLMIFIIGLLFVLFLAWFSFMKTT